MKKSMIFFIVIVLTAGCFTGCSRAGETEPDYQWQPPIEQVSWGQSKDEVFEIMGISEEDMESLGPAADGGPEMILLNDPLTFFGEDVQATLFIDPEYGLVRVSYVFVEDGKLEELLPELQEEYKSETGSQDSIYGSVPEQTDGEKLQRFKDYLAEEGMEESQIDEYCGLPLVIIEYNTDSSVPSYNSCNFIGSRAALWEDAQKEAVTG